MRSRRRHSKQDDSNTWIAYTDLLTTLLTFFVILAFLGMIRVRTLEARTEELTGKLNRNKLSGQVFDGVSKKPISSSTVELGDRSIKSDSEGKFVFDEIDLTPTTKIRLAVKAETYDLYSETIELQKGTNFKTVFLFKGANDGDVRVQMLEGDAFFESGRAQIKPEAIQKLKELGRTFKLSLQSDEVIVVQGHTDDVQYQNQSKSNWELSGERAAAVCRVFQEPSYGVNIPGKQLLALGYGEFRPKVIIEAFDSPDVLTDKRAQNRRIEIRKLKGAEVFASGKL
jgi:flagellar motor protein MotB